MKMVYGRFTIWEKLRHLFGIGCGMTPMAGRNGLVISYRCRICAKNDVLPEVWEERRLAEERGLDPEKDLR